MSKARPISSFGKTGINENPYENREGLVYCRVSSKRQEMEGSGLKTQEGRCIQDLRSVSVPYNRTFSDSYSGGGDFMKRPAMREMFEYIDKNPHKDFVVVFDDLKRFARDVEFHWKLRTAFKSRNVLLRCLNYNFDESPEGKFAELIMSGQAELERSQNARQVVQKQRARMLLGYHPFGAKRGYKQEKFAEHGMLSIRKEPDATYLQEALEGFSTGLFQRKIDACKFLVEKGFWKNQRPEKYIDKFSEILKDSFYAGFVEYSAWEVERQDGKHEGLVSLDVFELNQKRLNKEETGRKIRVDINPEFPMRGLIVCGYCKEHVTSGKTRGRSSVYPYYVCHNRDCENYGKSLKKEDVEVGFDEFLQKQKLKKDVSKVVDVIFDKAWKKEVGEFELTSKKSEKDILKLEKQIEELSIEIIESKSESFKNAIRKQVEKLEDKLTAQEQGINRENIDLSIPYRTALDKATGLLNNPYKIWKKLDVFEKQKLFFFIFDEKIPYHQKDGYRTAEKPYSIRLFEDFVSTKPQDVDIGGKRLNHLKTYLSEFWDYYQSSRQLQKALEMT